MGITASPNLKTFQRSGRVKPGTNNEVQAVRRREEETEGGEFREEDA